MSGNFWYNDIVGKYISKKHILIFLLLVISAVLFWLSSALQDSLYNFLKSVENLIRSHPLLGVLVFIVLTILSAMFVFFSTAVLVPVSVFVWGKEMTFVILLASWIIGGVASYFIGKYFGLKIVAHFVSLDRIEYYGKRITAHTGFSRMFLFRLLAPSEIPGYLLGMIRYKFSQYVIVTLLAELPFALGAVYASQIFLERKFIWFGGFIVIAAAVVISMKYYFDKEIHSVPKTKI